EVEGTGPAHVIAQQAVQLGPERLVLPRFLVHRLELIERGDQRFGHVAPTEAAEAAACARLRCVRHPLLVQPAVCASAAAIGRAARTGPAARAASMNARTLSSDFSPGRCSTPELTSTTAGAMRRIAVATLSGVSPPARTRRSPRGNLARALASSSHASATPVPPGRMGSQASTSSASTTPEYARAAAPSSSGLRGRTAFHTCHGPA